MTCLQKMRISRANSNVYWYEDIDTTNGQSGAAIVFYDSISHFDSSKLGSIIGIHNGGCTVGVNCGTRITRKHFMWIVHKLKSHRRCGRNN